MQQALVALEAAEELAGKHDAQLEYGFHQTITNLKAALEQQAETVLLECVTCGTVYADGVPPQVPVQQQAEPVAWIYDPITERIITPQRNPLTDEEALEIARTFGAQPWPPGSCVAFARAIEAAHGIKEKNT